MSTISLEFWTLLQLSIEQLTEGPFPSNSIPDEAFQPC